MSVVDYGCEPCGYTIRFPKLVGDTGNVFGVDIYELAFKAVRRKMQKHDVTNIEPVLVREYNTSRVLYIDQS